MDLQETTSPPTSTQKDAYNEAYASTGLVPFPDRKVEGNHKLVGKRIVSIGGGTGQDIAHLAEKNKVEVIDYSDSAAAAAKTFEIQHRVADLNHADFQLPYESGSVDVVVLKDILEHLLEPAQVLKEAKRVVHPNGYLVVSIPNHLNLWGRVRVLFGGNLIWRGILHNHQTTYEEWNYMHIRFFTWSGLKKMLQKEDLEITRRFFDFGPFGHYFSIPMYLEHLRLKSRSQPLSTKARLFLTAMTPLYRGLNLIFPERLRNAICQIAPSMLTSCFYLHVQKRPSPREMN